MITITRTRQKLTVSGHAGYAERGKDIVCEAVTSQVQTLTAAIHALTYDAPEIELRKGYFEMGFEYLSYKSLILVDAFMVGMQLLQNGYPEYVRVITEE